MCKNNPYELDDILFEREEFVIEHEDTEDIPYESAMEP